MSLVISPLRNKILAAAICIGGLLSAPLTSLGQFYNGSQMSFGKNRVQYNDFLWTYFKFTDFDVYFYLNGKELATHTAQYAQAYIPKIERTLQGSLSEKIDFVIFNNFSDLKQSNIGLISNTIQEVLPKLSGERFLFILMATIPISTGRSDQELPNCLSTRPFTEDR